MRNTNTYVPIKITYSLTDPDEAEQARAARRLANLMALNLDDAGVTVIEEGEIDRDGTTQAKSWFVRIEVEHKRQVDQADDLIQTFNVPVEKLPEYRGD